MALQWADTFNTYGTNISFMLDGLYADVSGSNATPTLVADPDPAATGNVLKVQADSNFSDKTAGARKVFTTSSTTVGLALRLYMSALPYGPARSPLISFRDVSNTTLFAMRVLSTGAIELRNGDAQDSSVQYGVTAQPVLAAHSWNHVEIKGTSNSSTGAIEVRVNGASVLTLTGLNTGGASIAQVYIGHYDRAAAIAPDFYYFKDFILWDTTGSFNNDFLGPVMCVDTLPDADNTFTWTPSTGTNGWSILDSVPPLDDAAYISAASNLVSKFSLANLPSTASSVRGNILKTRVRKTDGGDGNIQTGLISGASTSLGANRPITTAYTYWFDVNETDPATGAAWTPVAFNSALFQLARTV